MENVKKVLDILNQALRLEYSLIIHYPRINMAVHDNDIKSMVNTLGVMSIKHADVVSDAIISLGGTPEWSFDPAPEEIDLKNIFHIQLGKEKLALQLHSESSKLISDKELKTQFEILAKQEEGHIKIVENILSRLNQSAI
ncbi:MAG: ferritin-like domain-containing protein [Chloroflexi bacterium]|nr:ferritin-like domain-containing protein [Chloroflexota bacterium]